MRRMRSPASDALSGWTIGIAPATAASKRISTSAASAALNSSAPWVASSSLLAVTTGLPSRIASRIRLRAGSIPPITSTTTSTCGSATTSAAWPVSQARSTAGSRSLARSRTATRCSRMAAPARSASCSAWSASSRATPVPTTPHPSIPTATGSPTKCAPSLTETVGGPPPLCALASLVAPSSPAAPSSLLSPASARLRATSLVPAGGAAGHLARSEHGPRSALRAAPVRLTLGSPTGWSRVHRTVDAPGGGSGGQRVRSRPGGPCRGGRQAGDDLAVEEHAALGEGDAGAGGEQPGLAQLGDGRAVGVDAEALGLGGVEAVGGAQAQGEQLEGGLLAGEVLLAGSGAAAGGGDGGQVSGHPRPVPAPRPAAELVRPNAKTEVQPAPPVGEI